MTNEYVDLDEFDPLDPEATVSGVEGVAAATLEQYNLRRRLLAGNEEGVALVERLRFHAERGYLTPCGVASALMVEAADEIERIEALS